MVRLPVSSPLVRSNCTSAGSSIGGLGVGQGGQGGDAARRRGSGSGGDRLAVLEARLAQGRPHIDQSGAQDRPIRLDDGGAIGPAQRRTEIRDQPIAHQQIADDIDPGADDARPGRTACQGSFRRLPRDSMSSTAMRTATPISTCSLITLRTGSSATALSISTPRFIGPGCMTMASGFA